MTVKCLVCVLYIYGGRGGVLRNWKKWLRHLWAASKEKRTWQMMTTTIMTQPPAGRQKMCGTFGEDPRKNVFLYLKALRAGASG